MLDNRHQTSSDIETLGLSVAPSQCAQEDSELTLEDLMMLGKFFKRPWSYLLIDEAEVFNAVGQDNRSLRNQQRPSSAELLDQIQATVEMLATAAELFPETKFEVPSDVDSSTQPSTAGAVIREFLGVSEQAQLKAKDEFGALRVWVDALHRRGVYVSQRRLDDDTVRAFSRVQGAQAVIVVDTRDGAYARTFSLLHEYAHIVLRSTGICDLLEHSRIEQVCNAIAAATLMPTKLVREVLGERTFQGTPDSEDDLLRHLSNRLRVSQAALLIRLRELGVISASHYEALEERRMGRRSDSARTPGGTYYPPRINRVGRRYAREVFGALDSRQIDRQDASAALEIGEHLLNSYRSELGESEGRA
ncbi:MAG: ImmA/IrrE family metallo-endopeptidase [Actinomycetales bacterium]